MSTQTSSSTCTNLVEVEEVRGFITRCIERCGSTSGEHAACLADVLVEADLRGHYSHGLNRLEMYARELSEGRCDGMATPTVDKETCATALVDAKNGLGTVNVYSRFSPGLGPIQTRNTSAWLRLIVYGNNSIVRLCM